MPAAQQQGGDAGTLGGELQPAARDHRQPADFADHRGDAAKGARRAQPFFERPQDVVVARRRDPHDPHRVEPMRGEARPVKVATLQTPQHEARDPLPPLLQRISSKKSRAWPNPPGDAGDKARGGSAILLVNAGAEDFVQRAQGQPTAGQRAVDRGNAEGQHPVAQRIRALDPADAIL